jgi:hypothetical protein
MTWGVDTWGESAWGESEESGIVANELTQTGTLESGTFVQTYTVTANALSQSSNTLTTGNVIITQSVTANALTATGTLSASFTQHHSIGANALTGSSTLTQGTATNHHSITGIELTSNSTLTQASFTQTHSIIAVPLVSDNWLSINDKIYTALCFSPENQSTATWTNFNFFNSHQLNGKTLFIGNGGLFEYGGVTDNGSAINPSVKTGKMNVIDSQVGLSPSNRMKRIPKSRIDVNANKTTGKIDLTLTADNSSFDYHNQVTENGYATHRIKIGRGVKYNYLQLDVVGNGCETLDIDNIEFDSVELRRTQR